MANKAINQLPEAGNSQDTDIYILVRNGVNYKISRSNMPPGILTAQVTIPSADVLTMNATPVIVVSAAPAGKVVVVQGGLVEFANGSSNYATNTTITLVSTTAPGLPIRQASIADMTVPNEFITPATAGSSPMIEGDSVSAQVAVGNPITGNSDLTVTVWYTLMSV